MNPPGPNKKIIIWLLTGCLLIFGMVVIGGITRLTGSGLSITEWNVVMGAIPPLNDQQWNAAFEKYQQIPQFQKLNYNYTLEDFKNIFFWEYLHRLIGRLIGVVFIVPFLVFLVKGMLDRKLIRKVLFLFALGALQGFLGWFMVKSGLTERTSVSHIRLAIHLVAAFLTFGFTFWFALDILFPVSQNDAPKKTYSLLKVLLAVVLVQIIYGAFTAGLHAGRIANTFPTMDGQWIPEGMGSMTPPWVNLFDNLLTVQFVHRCGAYLTVLLVAAIFFQLRKTPISVMQRKAVLVLSAAIMFQFILGVCTLLTHVQITLAILHQSGAFFVFAASIYNLHCFRKMAHI